MNNLTFLKGTCDFCVNICFFLICKDNMYTYVAKDALLLYKLLGRLSLYKFASMRWQNIKRIKTANLDLSVVPLQRLVHGEVGGGRQALHLPVLPALQLQHLTKVTVEGRWWSGPSTSRPSRSPATIEEEKSLEAFHQAHRTII